MHKLILKLFTIFFLVICLKVMSAESVFISYRINQEIITNLDIEKEKRYLRALNDQLANLDEQTISELAKVSHIKEVVKKIELLKYFDLDQKNPLLKKVLKDFYNKLGLNSEDEFKIFLDQHDLTIDYIVKKMEIESTWNQLIFDTYRNQIVMQDKEILLKKIRGANLKKNNKKYLLSEILFELETGEKLDKKIDKINKSIDEIGFKNTANTYSISDSNKFGGALGWIDEKNLNNQLIKILGKLEIGNHSQPIQIPRGLLILKIENIKSEKVLINETEELKKMLQFGKNKQLERFSKIHYNKVKINTDINEG
jgi:peptidyl-prolyl cis-trans isomerase SurA